MHDYCCKTIHLLIHLFDGFILFNVVLSCSIVEDRRHVVSPVLNPASRVIEKTFEELVVEMRLLNVPARASCMLSAINKYHDVIIRRLTNSVECLEGVFKV